MDNPLVDSGISIHAPREGGDPPVDNVDLTHIPISIHAPREGGDRTLSVCSVWYWIFQSTPPARGATAPADDFCEIEDISIHAPREGGDPGNRQISSVRVRFQSTPPARGATSYSSAVSTPYSLFQSTPPARGATNGSVLFILGIDISIHAPREGGDGCQTGILGFA